MKTMTEEQEKMMEGIYWELCDQYTATLSRDKIVYMAMQKYAEWYAESLLPSEDVRNYFTLNKRFLKEWDTIRSRILDAIK